MSVETRRTPRHHRHLRHDTPGRSAGVVGDGSRSHDRVRSVSVSPGQDADAVEAVDLDHLVRSHEVEVLAGPGLPPLGASDAKHLDVASPADDVIAGSNVPGEGHLGLSISRAAFRHRHSLLSHGFTLQSRAQLSHPVDCLASRHVIDELPQGALEVGFVGGDAVGCPVGVVMLEVAGHDPERIEFVAGQGRVGGLTAARNPGVRTSLRPERVGNSQTARQPAAADCTCDRLRVRRRTRVDGALRSSAPCRSCAVRSEQDRRARA